MTRFTQNTNYNKEPQIRGYVFGPAGNILTLETLPEPNTKRWVARRKAEVVRAVEAGLLTVEQACERYNLSVDEFISWKKLVESYGLRGLRVTKIQKYRHSLKS